MKGKKSNRGVFSFSIFLFTIILLFALSVSFVYAGTVINSVRLNDTDNFYSNYAGNNIVHIIVNVSGVDTGGSVVANFSSLGFQGPVDCGASVGEAITLSNSTYGNGIYNGSCDLGAEASAAVFNASTPIITAMNSTSGYANVTGPLIVLYSLTTPPSPPTSSCTKFGPSTTNFTTVSDFAHVNFVIEMQANFTCLSQNHITDTVGFRDVMILNLASVDLSTPQQAQKLSLLQSAMNVTLIAPHQFGNARIYINSTMFSELNTNTTISFFYLPFTRLPAVLADNSTKLNNTVIWSSNGYDSALHISTINLTINVTGFSGYNVSDNATPVTTITSPTGSTPSFTAVVNVNVNGTGTEPSLIRIAIDNNFAVAYFNATRNDANCTVVGGPGSELYNCNYAVSNLVNGVHTINVTAYDYGGVSGNVNTTIGTFTISNLNTSVCTLTMTPTGTTSYLSAVTAVCSCTNLETSAKLYRNGTNVTSENGTAVFLPAGIYNYTCNVSATQNYTADSTSQIYTVTQLTPTLTITNNTAPMFNYGINSNITCAANVAEVTPVLSRNGVSLGSSSDNTKLAAGIYNYTCVNAGTQNYTAATSVNNVTITINQVTPTETITNNTLGVNYGNNSNISCSANTNEVTLVLYKNGASLGASTDNTKLAAGTYIYYCANTATQNYTAAASNNITLTINQATTTLTITNNTLGSSYGNNSNISCTGVQVTPVLYKNGVSLGASTDNTKLSAGEFNYTCISTGAQNYTDASSSTITLEISQITPIISVVNNTLLTLIYGSYSNMTCTGNSEVSSNLMVYRNGTVVGTSDNSLLGVGTYNYTCQNSATQNYTATTSAGKILTITQATPTLSVAISPLSNFTYGLTTTVTGNGCPTQLTCTLYMNGSAISTPNTTVLLGGNYDFVYNATANQNYTSTNSTHLFVTVKSDVNISSVVSGISNIVNKSVSNITITANGVDFTTNATSINITQLSNINLDFNVNLTSTNITPVVIQIPLGTSVNWIKTFNVTVNDSAIRNAAIANASVTPVEMILFRNFSNFVTGSGTYNVTISLKYNIDALKLEILYYTSDTSASFVRLSTTDSGNGYYEINGSNYTIVHLPHLSGIVVANDSSAPSIKTDTTSFANSYFNITGSIIEPNLNTTQTNYSITNTTLSYSNYGSLPTTNVNAYNNNTYNIGLINMSSGSYNLTIYAIDLNGQSNTTSFNIVVADTTAPNVTATPLNDANSVGSETVTITSDELARIDYQLNGAAWINQINNTLSTSFSISLVQGSNNLTINATDINGNIAQFNGTYNYTPATTTTPSSGGTTPNNNGGGSGITGGAVVGSDERHLLNDASSILAMASNESLDTTSRNNLISEAENNEKTVITNVDADIAIVDTLNANLLLLGLTGNDVKQGIAYLDESKVLLANADAEQNLSAKVNILLSAIDQQNAAIKLLPEVALASQTNSLDNSISKEDFSKFATGDLVNVIMSKNTIDSQLTKTLYVYNITNKDALSKSIYVSKIVIHYDVANLDGNVEIIENIPKSIAASAADISFSVTPQILQADPIVSWTSSVSQGDISYSVNGLLTTDEIPQNTLVSGNVKTTPTTTPSQPSTTTSATTSEVANSTNVAQPTVEKQTNWTLIIVLIVIIILVVIYALALNRKPKHKKGFDNAREVLMEKIKHRNK